MGLRKPFSEAYPVLLRIAERQGIAHRFDFDDVLAIAQDRADRRAQGEPDLHLLSRVGEIPYLVLSYLGQAPPPPVLLETFRERIERIERYVADGSIDDGQPASLELNEARRDIRQLRKFIKQEDGSPSTDLGIVDTVKAWAALAAAAVLEFALTSPKPSAVQ